MSRTPCTLAMLFLAIGGCAAGPRARPPAQVARSPALVMPHPLLLDAAGRGWPVDQRHWEFGRNDEPLVTAPTPPYRRAGWTEIRTREHLRTVNGRPREFSTTRIRTESHNVIR